MDNKLSAAATCAVDADTITVSYLTQKFTVHTRSMTGEISKDTTDTIGPSFRGLIVTITIQEAGEANQADLPQTLRKPYWNTDLSLIMLGKSKSQGFCAVSYGTRTDRELLDNTSKLLKAIQSEN